MRRKKNNGRLVNYGSPSLSRKSFEQEISEEETKALEFDLKLLCNAIKGSSKTDNKALLHKEVIEQELKKRRKN